MIRTCSLSIKVENHNLDIIIKNLISLTRRGWDQSESRLHYLEFIEYVMKILDSHKNVTFHTNEIGSHSQ